MANQWMAFGKAQLARKQVDLVNDTIKVVLVDAGGYTFSAAHKFLSDVPSGARVATGTLANKTVSDAGVWDADDPTVTAGASQPSAESMYFYHDTGSAATSELLVYDDSFTSGMPFTPPVGGGDALIVLNAAGIGTL